MITRILRRLEGRGWVDWGVILIGLRGIARAGTLPPSFVADFATAALQVISKEDSLFCPVAQLSVCEQESIDEIRSLVEEICDLRQCDLLVAARKWRLAALEETLDSMGDDPIRALLHLTEFWSDWGNPSDSPHIVQGVANSISPADYYSAEMFLKIRRAHEAWIKDQVRVLGG